LRRTEAQLQTTKTARRGAWLVAAWLSCGTAIAAGGHHGVDDASILAPGQCELESWFSHSRASERLLHAGASCRVGPLELGAASESAREDGSSGTGWQLEAKWAREVADHFSVGVAVQPAWQAHVRPRYQGAAVLGLATWEVRENLSLHLNAGREFVHRGDDQARGGLAVEWIPLGNWSVVAERYREQATQFARAGVRWFGGEHWSVDLSRSHRLSGPGASAWTLGASFLLDRP
jgi:hypothetical protein